MPEVHEVRCVDCRRLVAYRANDTDPLVRHVIENHPEITVMMYGLVQQRGMTSHRGKDFDQKSSYEADDRRRYGTREEHYIEDESKGMYEVGTGKPKVRRIHETEVKRQLEKKREIKKPEAEREYKKKHNVESHHRVRHHRYETDDTTGVEHHEKEIIRSEYRDYDRGSTESNDYDVRARGKKDERREKYKKERKKEMLDKDGVELKRKPRDPKKSRDKDAKVVKKVPKTKYDTTVEWWKPGQEEVKCPQCGFRGTPLARTALTKEATNGVSFVCKLAYWPCCFLPKMMLKRKEMTKIYCSKCGYKIAQYDPQSGVAKLSANKKLKHKSQPKEVYARKI